MILDDRRIILNDHRECPASSKPREQGAMGQVKFIRTLRQIENEAIQAPSAKAGATPLSEEVGLLPCGDICVKTDGFKELMKLLDGSERFPPKACIYMP